MIELRYDIPEKELKRTLYSYENSVFLAGPTVRGHQQHLQPSWRFEACNTLKQLNYNGAVVIPEFPDTSLADKGNEDWIVPWEFCGLKYCRHIVFWIPRTKELIGLNTNFEFGYWLSQKRTDIIYGRPEGSYRNKYLDIMWQIDAANTEICTSLSQVCEKVIALS